MIIIPLWAAIIIPFCTAIVGFFTCAMMTMSKVADAQSTDAECSMWEGAWHHATGEHARCADALEAARARIDRALAVETPKAAHGVRKMAAILRGDL